MRSTKNAPFCKLILKERKGILRALMKLDSLDFIKVLHESETDDEDVFSILKSYPNRLNIFHYGGHANSENIFLQKVLLAPNWRNLGTRIPI